MIELSCGLEASHYLECVVDPPLETCQGAYHQDSSSETSPKTGHSNIAVDFLDLVDCTVLRLSSLIELGYHGVCWVRDNCAEDTCPVSRHEGDWELCGFWVLVSFSWEPFPINELDCVLEASEFDHCVWYLSHPQRLESLVEPLSTFSFFQVVDTSSKPSGERTCVVRLLLDFHCFHWAQKAVGNDLCAGRGKQKADCLIFGSVLSECLSVNIFEDFVESKLAETLSWVSEESWHPSLVFKLSKRTTVSPRMPSWALMVLKPSAMLLYISGFVWSI